MGKEIIVTYNFPPVNHWRKILSEFIGDLFLSGLYNRADKIVIFCKETPLTLECFSHLSLNGKFEFHFVEENIFLAMEQLRYIDKQAKQKEDTEMAFLYSSARGISYDLRKDPQRFLSVSYWARMLNYFSIFDHANALKALDSVDAVGTNWVPNRNVHGVPAHFQGLGWWANSNYLKKLPDVPGDEELQKMLSTDPLYAQKPGKNPGWGLWGEFWIGFANPKIFEQFSSYDKQSNGLGWHYKNILHESIYDSSYLSEPKK